MKNCLLCGKVLEEKKEIVCKTCRDFFDWKHSKNSEKRLRRFRELLKRDRKFNKTKLGREK